MAEQLLEFWKCGQKHLNEFLKLWRNEYLISLREGSQVLLKGPCTTSSAEAKVGDIVLLKENYQEGDTKLAKFVS